MTDIKTLAALADEAARKLLPRSPDGSERLQKAREVLFALARESHELGRLDQAPTATRKGRRSALGIPEKPSEQQGLIARVIHPISAASIAEHGEIVLLAWIQQSVRELADHGANPFRDASIDVVGMDDGSTVVTAEGRVQG